MASILQVLFSIDSFKQTYFPTLLNHRSTCTNSNHATCFACQMEKVAEGLLSGRYSVSRPKSKQALAQEEQEQQRQQQQQPQQQQEESPLTEEEKLKRDELDRGQLGIKPLMFKSLIGAEHPEFATMRQQDAFEFFEYFCSQLEQKERTRLGSAADGRLPTSVFDFALEQRLECLSCHGARYSTSNSNVASIPLVRHKLEESSVPADTADNAATAPATTTQATTATVALSTSTNKKEPPMPKEVAYFDESLALFAADEVVEFRCPVCGANPAGAVKRNRFLTTPDVLVVHAKRFVYEDWVPRKLGECFV